MQTEGGMDHDQTNRASEKQLHTTLEWSDQLLANIDE